MSLAQLMAEIRQVSKRSVEAYTLHIANHLLMRRLIMSCLKSLLTGKRSQFSMELLYTSYLLIDIDYLGMQQCYDRSTLVVKAYLQAFVKDIGKFAVDLNGWTLTASSGCRWEKPIEPSRRSSSECHHLEVCWSIAWTGCTPLSMIVLWMQRLR